MVHSANTPIVISPIGWTLIINVLIVIPIIIGVIDYTRVKKQKKTINSTTIYGHQPLRIKGQAKRQPLHDFFPQVSSSAYFYNSVSLTIKNEGNLPIDADAIGQSIMLNLVINGKLDEELEDVKIESANKQVMVSVKEGQLILDHVKLESGQSFELCFFGWFAVPAMKLFAPAPLL